MPDLTQIVENLDPDHRYAVRYDLAATERTRSATVAGYLELTDTGALAVYRQDADAHPAIIPLPFVEKITHERATDGTQPLYERRSSRGTK